jgi:hypothetical protein
LTRREDVGYNAAMTHPRKDGRLRPEAGGRNAANGEQKALIDGAGADEPASQGGEFIRLAEQWQAETRHLSSAEQIASHPAYQKIIGMGAPAVPLILQELKRRPAPWFRALHAITGANPVCEADRGRLPRMAEAWIRWGREQGYAV